MAQSLKDILARVKHSDGLAKVFSFTAISTLVKFLTGFISVKVVATLIGPAGIALLGQLNNFSSIIMTIASGGINNGVTKYIAEYKESESTVKDFLSTALKITLVCSFVCGVLLIIFSTGLSSLILKSTEYYYVFVILGITLFLYALNNLLISILNGYKEFKKYVSVNIAGSILGLAFTVIFVYTLSLKGALISAVTFQSITFFASLWMIRELPWVTKSYFKEKFNIIIAHKYFKYALMTFVTAATVPISQLFLRSYVISNISVTEAGWWEAMNRISGMYLMILTSSFGVYYLPKLSEISDRLDLRKEIFKAYKIIIPIVLVGFVLIYVCRIFIIRILFTPDFLPMEQLFVWQLAGDFFKIVSWLLAFVMVAKTMTKTYIITEILFAGLLVGLGLFLVNLNGITGITQAYAINYFVYSITMIVIFRKLIFN